MLCNKIENPRKRFFLQLLARGMNKIKKRIYFRALRHSSFLLTPVMEYFMCILGHPNVHIYIFFFLSVLSFLFFYVCEAFLFTMSFLSLLFFLQYLLYIIFVLFFLCFFSLCLLVRGNKRTYIWRLVVALMRPLEGVRDVVVVGALVHVQHLDVHRHGHCTSAIISNKSSFSTTTRLYMDESSMGAVQKWKKKQKQKKHTKIQNLFFEFIFFFYIFQIYL